jgi:hypothetical protein
MYIHINKCTYSTLSLCPPSPSPYFHFIPVALMSSADIATGVIMHRKVRRDHGIQIVLRSSKTVPTVEVLWVPLIA